jgi:hypothetical protein
MKSGTIATSAGPIVWSRSSDGTVNANGAGQQLTITVGQATDGSSQSKLVFSRVGQNPYLTVQTVAKESQNAGTLTVNAGQSHLTLALAEIDRTSSSATATVSGSILANAAAAPSAAPGKKAVIGNGSPGTVAQAINWTGRVDLTKNPLVGRPISGWPQQAFASELKAAAFFAPLGKVPMDPAVTPPQGGASSGAAGHGGLQQKSTAGSVLKGLTWGAAAALGAAVTGGAALPIIAAGLAGFDASMGADLISEWDSQVPAQPPPNPDPPPTEDPTGPSTQVSHEDPPPPPDGSDDGSGGGGGDPSADDKPGHEQQ